MSPNRTLETELQAYREAYILLADGVIQAIDSLKTHLPDPDTKRGQDALLALVELHAALDRSNGIIVERVL